MAVEVKLGVVFAPGSGATDQVEICVAVYQNGTLQPVANYSGGNGSLNIEIVDEASPSDLAAFDETDLTEGAASEAASHYWARKTVSGVAGAQCIAAVISADVGGDTLEDTQMYSVRFAG